MKSKKFKLAQANNRKKQLTVTYSSGKTLVIHYGSLGIFKNIERVWVDSETRGQSLGIEYSDGTIDFMPYDQPLAISKDPEFILQNQVEVLIAEIKKTLQEKKISKRYLAEQLHTSDNQVHRLLDPTILNKNLEQLYKIASLTGIDLQLRINKIDSGTEEAAA
jgi:hypothetical protein